MLSFFLYYFSSLVFQLVLFFFTCFVSCMATHYIFVLFFFFFILFYLIFILKIHLAALGLSCTGFSSCGAGALVVAGGGE